MIQREYVRLLITSSVLVAVFSLAVWNKERQSHRLSTSREGPAPTPSAQPIASGREHQSVHVPEPIAGVKVRSGFPTMFHLDPARTNRSPFEGPKVPHLVWSFDAKGPVETAFALNKDGNCFFGTLAGDVFALSVANGRKLMRWEAGDRVYGSPLVLGTDVVIGVDNHRIVRLSQRGTLVWSLEVDGEADTAACLTDDGRILTTAGETLYSLRRNGSVIWRVVAKRKFFSSVAVGPDGTAYVGCQDDRIYAVDRRGIVRWNVDMGADVDCAPAVGEAGVVYVGADRGAVAAIEAKSGKVLWRTNVGGHVRGGVTLTRRGTLVVGTYGPAPRVVALNASNGKILWRFGIQGTGATEFGIHGSPVEDRQGRLYFGAQDDQLYALDPTGRLLWKYAMKGDVDAPVAIIGEGRLIAADDSGRVVCLGSR